MNLIVDGVELTFLSSLDLSQTYAAVNNGTLLRLANGDGIKQVPAWGKLKTEISGNGWLPDGLSGIDFDNSVVVDCVGHRSITSPSNAIVIPGTVRPDATPWGVAYVNGQWQDVASSWLVDTLTIDVTPGATQYQALWLPRLTLFCDKPETQGDRASNTYSWTLTGEEV